MKENEMEPSSEGINITPKLLVIIGVAVLGFMIYMGFALHILDTSRDVPTQNVSPCIITNKTTEHTRFSAIYLIESSCGKLSTSKQLWESLEVQKSYELTLAHDEWPFRQNIVQATKVP